MLTARQTQLLALCLIRDLNWNLIARARRSAPTDSTASSKATSTSGFLRRRISKESSVKVFANSILSLSKPVLRGGSCA